jgi:hypothetical protein
MIDAIAHPLSGTFEQNVRAVFELHKLPLFASVAYAREMSRRHEALTRYTHDVPAADVFGYLNSRTLEKILGLDPIADRKLIVNVRDDLWYTLTGVNLRVYHIDDGDVTLT